MVSKFSGYRFSQCGSSGEGDMKVMLKLGGKSEFVTKTIQILREVQTKKKRSGGCYLSRRQSLCPARLPPTACAGAHQACVTDSLIAQEHWPPKNKFHVPHCPAKDSLGMCHESQNCRGRGSQELCQSEGGAEGRAQISRSMSRLTTWIL